jgi:hypothetical protein
MPENRTRQPDSPAGVPSSNGDNGAWVVYDRHHELFAISLHFGAADAAHAAARAGQGLVAFWPYGMTLEAAVEKWLADGPQSMTG